MNPVLARLLSSASVASFSAPLDAASAAAGADVWLRLMPAGRWSARDGRGPFMVGDRAAMSEIVARTHAYHGETDIVVDYDHQTVFGARDGVGGTARAAGWVKELQVRDDGIYGRVEWTAAAAEAIRAKEYRYLSPVVPKNDRTGEVAMLHSVAITNSPALHLELVAASSLFPFSSNEGTHMEKILKALGLAEGSGEDAVLSAIADHMAATTALAAIAAAAGLKADAKAAEVESAAAAALSDRSSFAAAAGLKAGASSQEIVAALTAASSAASPDPTKYVPLAAVSELQSEVKLLKDAAIEKAATDAVDAAMAAGKLSPAMRGWGLDLYRKDAKAFEAFASGAPALTERQQRQERKPADGPDLSDPVALSAAATVYQKKLADAGQSIDFAAAVNAVKEGKR